MCKKPQTLLAQFVHNEERLNLGKSGRVLFNFQCNYEPGNCETWDANSGANSCFVLDHADLTEGPTALPAGDVTIETEARVEDPRSDGTVMERTSGMPEWATFLIGHNLTSLPSQWF